MLNLKLHSLNTIYNEYSTSIHLMLGPQVGIVVKETHNISYCAQARKLFEYYLEKLDIKMSFYTVGLPYFRYIYFKEIQVEDHIRIGDL